jgi:hypothetical protein
MTSRVGKLWVLALACTLTIHSTTSWATGTEDPEALIKQGVDLRQKGDDARAEVYLRRAYQIAQTPRSAAQLGLVELALERFLQAEQYLSEALSSDDVWISNHRTVLETSRDGARKNLARIEISDAPPETQVTANGGKQVKLADDGFLWVQPGVVALKVEAPGRAPVSYSRNLAAGQSDKIAVPPTVTPALPPVEPQPSLPPPTPVESSASDGRTARIAGVVTASVGAAAAVTGLVLFEVAGTKLHHIETETTYTPSDGNWKGFNDAGVGLLIGGAVAVAGGAALYLWGRSASARDDEPSHSQASIRVAPGLEGVTLLGAF